MNYREISAIVVGCILLAVGVAFQAFGYQQASIIALSLTAGWAWGFIFGSGR